MGARLLEQIIENAELSKKHEPLLEIIKKDPDIYQDQIRIFERAFIFNREQKESKTYTTEKDSEDVYSALDKLSIPHSEKLLNNNLGGFH